MIVASGEVDLACARAVAVALAEAVTAPGQRVVIDASAVTFIDCAGLRALLAPPPGWEGAWEVELRAPSRPVSRLLQLIAECGLFEAKCLDGNEGLRCSGASDGQWHVSGM